MKNIVLLFILFTGIVNAQIVNIPDPNFKAALIDDGIDTNNDGEIQTSEAFVVNQLHVDNSGITNLIGLGSFVNVTSLYCDHNAITFLDLSTNPNINYIKISYNQLSYLNASNNVGLTDLLIDNNNLNGINVSNNPNLTDLWIFHNNLTSLDVSSCTNLSKLSCGENLLTTLNLIANLSLSDLQCADNDLTTLNVNGLTNLSMLHCENNNLTTINLANLTSLQYLYCNANAINSVNISPLVSLKILDISNNNLSSLSVIGHANLQKLNAGNNTTLTNFTLNNLPAITELSVYGTNIGSLNASPFTTLTYLDCNVAHLNTLNVNGLVNLTYLTCALNQLPTIDVSSLVNVTYVSCGNNLLTSLNISGLTHLQQLHGTGNQLTSINITGNNTLVVLNLQDNLLTNFDLSGAPNLTQLDISYNPLTAGLNVTMLPLLTNLICDFAQLTSLDVSQNTNLAYLTCGNNQLTTLDCSNNPNLYDLGVYNNQLVTLFIKNGSNEQHNPVNYNTNLTLQYICADDSQIGAILTSVNANAAVNSYCSFTPGGNYNTITGTTKFDTNNNGCDATDLPQPLIRVNINDGTNQGATFTNAAGEYTFYTLAGNYTLTPSVENPTWFNFSPPTFTVPFANATNNSATQNFCISPNGFHNDLEIIIEPVTPARPGFNATYKIVYKNKGNTTPGFNSGARFEYNPNKMSFVSASQVVGTQGANYINFDYSNLLPFESRSILVTFHINSPTDSNPVNIGDILPLHANIGLNIGDENVIDNDFYYNQTVVGSFDPNNIICIEGPVVSPSQIGNYLHYAINFENTGTYQAENVVVRDIIDLNKFDINSLQLLNTSHASYIRIKENVVEFVFENINLAAAAGDPPVGGHGNILFKIKSKSNLVTNDFVSKSAAIYFDYNAPIETNVAQTTFQLLNNTVFDLDSSVIIHPNPTSGMLQINSDFIIQSIQLYDIQGRLLLTILENATETVMNVATYQSGIYFVKINTEKGSKVEKIMKE